MFQEYFRQRDISIQKTIQTRQNHYLSLYRYFTEQIDWKKHLPNADIIPDFRETTISKAISATLNNYRITDSLGQEIFNITNLKTDRYHDGCVFNATDYLIGVWLTEDCILLTFYNFNFIGKLETFQLDMNCNFTVDEFFNFIKSKYHLT